MNPNRAHILIIEDDSSLSEIYNITLSDSGFDIESVEKVKRLLN